MEEPPPEFDFELEDIRPLRGLVTEIHEVHLELLAVGFSNRDASQIVSFMLYDAIAGRETSDEDEDDEEDDTVDEHDD
jgi:hypothetical protein